MIRRICLYLCVFQVNAFKWMCENWNHEASINSEELGCCPMHILKGTVSVQTHWPHPWYCTGIWLSQRVVFPSLKVLTWCPEIIYPYCTLHNWEETYIMYISPRITRLVFSETLRKRAEIVKMTSMLCLVCNLGLTVSFGLIYQKAKGMPIWHANQVVDQWMDATGWLEEWPLGLRILFQEFPLWFSENEPN